MNLENFHERMQRVLLMSPLYRLARRANMKTADGREISCMEFGLMALLFFFEHMLDGKKKSGIRNLSLFFKEQTRGILQFTDDGEYEKLARDIVDVFRPSTGRRNEEEFFNWDTGKPDRVQYSYLKASKADIDANEQYYLLDEQGLELIFATKEYFNEFQLSINQLILRKQLEKGQFVLALRQIEEMRLDVETIKDRIHRISGEIHRNIVSEKTLERYRKIVSDINLRLKGEEDEFVELKDFVRETKERIHSNVAKDPERRAYENILEVELRLDVVHGAHRSLLQLGIELGTSALNAAQEALYFSGLDIFNFDQEITSRVFSSPLPLSAARVLVEPLLSLEQKKTWSPVAVFLPQRLERLEIEQTQSLFPDIGDRVDDKRQLENLQDHYARIVALLVEEVQDTGRTTLHAFLERVREEAPDLADSKQFYVFWLLIHRKGELVFDEEVIRENSPFYQILQKMPVVKKISAVEYNTILCMGEKFSISDMKIKVVTE